MNATGRCKQRSVFFVLYAIEVGHELQVVRYHLINICLSLWNAPRACDVQARSPGSVD